jgi:hypothetical protein
MFGKFGGDGTANKARTTRYEDVWHEVTIVDKTVCLVISDQLEGYKQQTL